MARGTWYPHTKAWVAELVAAGEERVERLSARLARAWELPAVVAAELAEGGGPPSRDALRRWVAEARARLQEAHGAPWALREAEPTVARVVLAAWAAASAWLGEPAPWPSRRQAEKVAWLLTLAPDLPPAGAYTLSRLWAAGLGEPSLALFLGLGAWRSPAAWAQYQQVVEAAGLRSLMGVPSATGVAPAPEGSPASGMPPAGVVPPAAGVAGVMSAGRAGAELGAGPPSEAVAAGREAAGAGGGGAAGAVPLVPGAVPVPVVAVVARGQAVVESEAAIAPAPAATQAGESAPTPAGSGTPPPPEPPPPTAAGGAP
jgi:hypothetical protein